MKKLLSLVSALFFFFFAQSFTGDKQTQHIGTWSGKDSNGTRAQWILDKTNHCVFKMGDQVMGGEEMESKYVIDYTKNPIWLDILLVNKKTQVEMARMKGIVRFPSDKKMEYRGDFDKPRFKTFDATDKENTVIFDKIAE